VEDSLLGIRVVKSFAKENAEQEKFDKGNTELLRLKKQRYSIMAAFTSCTRLFDGIMYIVVVMVGGVFLLNGNISAADYVAYLMFVSTLLTSIRRIVEFSEQFQLGMSGIERFAEIMDTEPEIQSKNSAKVLSSVRGDVEFCGVGFKYEADTPKVLDNLNLKVKAGENIALVGPSGGGKTTLCSLIPRFYDTSEGSVKIDGVDVKDVTLDSLRENVGVVAQDVYLFSGSVRENIAYGKSDATDEEIERAARLAGAHEFICELPDGYNTYVGERGVKLSGGQKQRISIARVFLKDPPILVLDEATSALDNESEKLVQSSLETLAKGRTTFTIAHRLTTIRNADRILVLTENGIEESGSHEELLKKGGIYSELYSMYSEN
jgi:ATP-binding cassette subfamily B protein